MEQGKVNALEISGFRAEGVPDDEVAAGLALLENPVRDPKREAGIFALTLLGFAAVGLMAWSPMQLALLVGVILIHEGGHFLAMKAFGYANPRIFFVPGLGAVTAARKSSGNPIHELVVLLMGPVPGILIGIALVFAYREWRWILLADAAKMFLTLNLFNLLPIAPLDGGRFLEIAWFKRVPVLATGLRLLSVAALAWLGYQDGTPGLFVLAFLFLVPIRESMRSAKAEAGLRKRLADHSRPESERLGLARASVAEAYDGQPGMKIYLHRIQRIQEAVRSPILRMRTGLLAGAGYALLTLLLIGVGSVAYVAVSRLKAKDSADFGKGLALETGKLPWESKQPGDPLALTGDSANGPAVSWTAAPGSGAEMHLAMIIVETRVAADLAVKNLAEGADFAALARKYSKGPTAEAGGDVGYVHPSDLDPAQADSIKALCPGCNTRPLGIRDGYMIIKRLE